MGEKLVSEGGLAPPSPKATDFKSVVYTVSTPPTLFMLSLLIIAKALVEFLQNSIIKKIVMGKIWAQFGRSFLPLEAGGKRG